MKDITGLRSGKLIALYPVGQTKGKTYIWKCQCDCGNVVDVPVGKLTGTIQKSCGCIKGNHKLPYGQASFNAIYSKYRCVAIKRGFSFEITKDQFKRLTQQRCFYCGQLPSNEVKKTELNGSYIYNGLDRINNELGYTVDNCVPCCNYCNKAKNNQTYPEFLERIRRIYELRVKGK